MTAFHGTTFRRFSLLLEISALLTTFVILYVAVWFTLAEMNRSYLELRRADAAKVHLFLERHLDDARETLAAFLELTEAERSSAVLKLSPAFSDIYLLDQRLRVSRIYKAKPGSKVFTGFSFSSGKLDGYLKADRTQSDFSKIMRGYEDDAPSVYYALRYQDDLYLGRLNLGYVLNFLMQFTKFSDNPVMLIAKDGFVMLSGDPDLRIPSFDLKKWGGAPSASHTLLAGNRRWTPVISETSAIGAGIVVLIPTKLMETQRSSLLLFISAFMVVLILLVLVKDRQTNRLVIQPLVSFTKKMRELEQGRRPTGDDGADYRFKELAVIQRHFRSMAEAITQREQALSESEQKYRLLTERMKDVIWTLDTETMRFLYVSPSVEALWGGASDELLHQPVDVTARPETLNSEKELIRRRSAALLSGQEPSDRFYVDETEMYRKDTTRVWVEVVSSYWLNDRTGRVELRAVTRDISKRKMSEARLTALADMSKNLLEKQPLEQKLRTITDAVVKILDADFARVWMLRGGDRCESGCGHASITDDGAPICRDRTRCLHLLASSGRYTHTDGLHARVPLGAYEIGRLILSDKTWCITNDVTHDSRISDREWAAEPGLVSFAGFSLFSSEKEPLGVLGLFSRHHVGKEEIGSLTGIAATTSQVILAGLAEESLIEARKDAEAANRAKSQFLASMSHEIRTPMNAVLGLAQLLEKEPLSPDQLDMVRRIRVAGHSLLGILNDILDFSRIEVGRLKIESQPFTLTPLLRHLEILLGNVARGKGLDFSIKPTFEPDGSLLGDILRLEQILLNLIGNAVKFTEHGEILVRVRPVELFATTARLRFEVHDTGVGIAPESLANLFQPFTQADGSITRRFGGAGLGLSICKRLVELMGGTIGADSSVGVGSVFWFEIPFERTTVVAVNREDAPRDVIPSGPRLCGLRLLVVDDSDINRDLLDRALTREGGVVALAEEGGQALAALRASPQGFDAVLMDVQMPIMDGLTATRILRSELGLTGLPVIAFTAGVLQEERQNALDAGVNDFLPKPVDLEEMVAMLLRWTRPSSGGASDNAPARTDLLDSHLALPEIPGIDSEWVTDTFGADRKFFLELLEKFIFRFEDVGELIRSDLARGDREAAARRLHTLKGTAGNLGALELMGSAEKLEQAIREGQCDLEAFVEQIVAQLAALKEAGSPWLKNLAESAPLNAGVSSRS